MSYTLERVTGYAAPAGYLWDPWFVEDGDRLHLFHLYQPAPAAYDPLRGFERNRPVIGHAVWSATGWETRPIAVDYTGTAYDAERIHTGCIVCRNDQWWMLYSGSRRHVCLAVSDDLETWTKHVDNPLLSPDERLYASRWRDPYVFSHPSRPGFTMLLAAQRAGQDADGVVAVAHADDLLHWQQEEPLAIPPWFVWLEVPEIHHIGDRWYLIFVTRSEWITEAGKRNLLAQGIAPETGAFQMVADDWRGPYERVARLFEAGSPRYTTRLMADGEDLWLWSHRDGVEQGERKLVLLAPVRCRVSDKGYLVASK